MKCGSHLWTWTARVALPATPPLLRQLGSTPFPLHQLGSKPDVEGRPAGPRWTTPPSLRRETCREDETATWPTTGTTSLPQYVLSDAWWYGLNVLYVPHACMYVCACVMCVVHEYGALVVVCSVFFFKNTHTHCLDSPRAVMPVHHRPTHTPPRFPTRSHACTPSPHTHTASNPHAQSCLYTIAHQHAKPQKCPFLFSRHAMDPLVMVAQSVQSCASIQRKLHMLHLVARSLGDRGWNKHWLRGN